MPAAQRGFNLVERIPDARELFARDADAGVLHGDPHLVLVRARRDRHASAIRRELDEPIIGLMDHLKRCSPGLKMRINTADRPTPHDQGATSLGLAALCHGVPCANTEPRQRR